MKLFPRLIVGIFALLGLFAALCGVAFVVSGISTRSAPNPLEASIARAGRHLLIPSHARAAVSPITVNEDVLTAARDHFADHCATCHANNGSGDTAFGRRLSPRAPDLRSAATQRLSDGELFWIIENGVKLTGMPGFGDDDPTNDVESWALVAFIRRLPKLSGSDLAAMELKNPTLSRADVVAEQERQRFLAGDDPKPDSHDHP